MRKWISTSRFERFDAVLKRQGVIVILVLFVFPGFPKDYLCLFLGLSTFPAGVFMIMAALGRMPGTLMLSLQGALLYEKMYGFFGILMVLCLLIALVAYRYRESIYGWVEKVNGQT